MAPQSQSPRSRRSAVAAFLSGFWREWVRPMGLAALVVCSLRSAIADWNDVPTGSMKPTILEGERIAVNRLAYDLKVPFTTWHLAEWGGPARGDVVVLKSPADGVRLVKRVVGLPGDVLEMRANRVFLHGEPLRYEAFPTDAHDALPESEREGRVFALEQLGTHLHPVSGWPSREARRSFGPIRIPEGHYFVMGDSRDDSFDSRYFGWVAREAILGRAEAVVASLDPKQGYAPRWNRWFQRLP